MPLNNVNIDIQNKDKIYLEKPKKLIKNLIVPKFINKME